MKRFLPLLAALLLAFALSPTVHAACHNGACASCSASAGQQYSSAGCASCGQQQAYQSYGYSSGGGCASGSCSANATAYVGRGSCGSASSGRRFRLFGRRRGR